MNPLDIFRRNTPQTIDLDFSENPQDLTADERLTRNSGTGRESLSSMPHEDLFDSPFSSSELDDSECLSAFSNQR